jgi:S1-C subfamily serine protease
MYDLPNNTKNTPNLDTNRQQTKVYPKPSINTKATSRTNPVSNFFRNVGIIFILVLAILSSLFAFIVINPDQPFSRWVVNSTPVSRILSLGQTGNNQNTPTVEKVANNLFGLNTNSSEADNQPTVQVIAKVLPSVLSLNVRSRDNQSVDAVSVAGTGFVVSADGLVVTNKHVISDVCDIGQNQIQITALNSDQKSYELQLVSLDPIDDIAILKIQNPDNNLVPVSFADSSKLRLGEETIAIGNVLGALQNTITKGIISGLNRSLEEGPQDLCTGRNVNTDGLIQTDAAINRGNSGGPLFNSQGQLIGMNTFGTSDAQSVGLAIPSRTITDVLNSYKTNGQIVRPRLGIFSRPITPIDKSQLSWLPVDYGEIIFAPRGSAAVDDTSAAARVGLAEGDIVTEINGQKIQYRTDNPSPLRRILLNYPAKQEIELQVLKATKTGQGTYQYGNERQTIKVVLGGVSLENNQLKFT